MTAEKSGPSFASILTILSIVMYTGGFLRMELEFIKGRANRSCSVLKRTKCALNWRITSNSMVEEQDHTSGVIILRSTI